VQTEDFDIGAEIAALLAAALLLNVFVAILPMRLGLKKLSSLEV